MIGGLRQFAHLGEADHLFAQLPETIADPCDRSAIAEVLGASLYTPATRPTLLRDIESARAAGTVSMVLDLEDSVDEVNVEGAADNLVRTVQALWERTSDTGAAGIALFVRTRHLEDIAPLLERLGESAGMLVGIVVPKFRPEHAAACFDAVRSSSGSPSPLYVMPVVETREFIRADCRLSALADLRDALAPYRDSVLTIRIGGTDFAGIYGLRRTPDLTIYDVQVVASALGDIVNMLGEPSVGYPVSGPVWEHFAPRERVLRPQLRATPFVEHDAVQMRNDLLVRSYDGLVREVLLDRANGMTGKSVIHPDQAAIVNALSVVTDEEYLDAQQVLATRGAGGVTASEYGNKMNESRPHTVWAERTVRRARAFGVAHPGRGFIDVLTGGPEW